MNIKVKLTESNDKIDVKLDQVTVVTDGGYERGYEAGYTTGNAEGYGKGYNNGLDEGYTNGYEEGALLTDKLADRTITEITSNISTIGSYAFYQCTSLTKAHFPNATVIKTNAFQVCNDLKDLYIPNVQNIEAGVFYRCTSLVELDLPYVPSIPASSFADCSKLERITFPKATSIGQYAFQNCSNLLGADLVSVNTTLAVACFYNCPKFATLIIRNQDAVVAMNNVNCIGRTAIANGTGFVYVPDHLVDNYKSATNWSTYANQIKPLSELEG